MRYPGQDGSTSSRRRRASCYLYGRTIASGIFDATGALLYQMPMTPERVLQAIKKTSAQ